MATINSDKAWKAYGKKNAYYGVLTHDEFKDDNLNDGSRELFFKTGFEYVDKTFDEIYCHFDSNFKPDSIFDFGCGTGRLAIPFAKKARKVVGMDISEDMLDEARINAEKMGQFNIDFLLSDDTLSALKGQKFDLINSYIVLQHINVERGMIIIETMLNHLNKEGIGVLQLTYASNKSQFSKMSDYFRYRVPLLNGLINVVKGNPYSKPLMQMNSYDMNKVFRLLQQNGIDKSHVIYEDHGGFLGLTLYFQK